MTRACLYLRQSDSRGEGDDSLSIASQESAGRTWAARNGADIVAVYVDADLKGWQDDTQRPGLAAALALAEAHGCDALVVWDLSRLARSVRIQEMIVWRLARAGVELVSLQEPHAGDHLIRQIHGAINEYRTREIAGHVRRAIAERTARGLSWSTVPFGYVRRSDGKLEPDSEIVFRGCEIGFRACEIVKWIFAEYADGAGIAAITDSLTERGIPSPARGGPWRLQTVRFILSNPAYRGTVVGRSGAVEDAHEAIIDAGTWERCQARLGSKRRGPKRKQHSSWLEGRILHGCGRPMYLSPPQGRMSGPAFRCQAGHDKRVPGGRCGTRPYQAMARVLEARVWELVVEALADVAPADRVYRRLVARAKSAEPLVARRRKGLEERQSFARDRLARAETLYTTGRRDLAWFDVEDARGKADLAAIDAELAALPVAPDLDELRETEAALRELAATIADTDPADRGTVLDRIGTAMLDEMGVWVRWRDAEGAFVADDCLTAPPARSRSRGTPDIG